MPTFEITSPTGEVFEVTAPEGASEADILAYARANMGQPKQPETFDPTEGMSTFDKVAAGAGKAVYDTGRGIGQLLGLVSDEDVARARERDAALMDTGAGLAGNILGSVATIAAPGGVLGATGKALNSARMANVGRAIAAPNTFKSAAATGGIYSGLQPVVGDESRAANAAIGAGAGLAGQGVAKALGAAVKPSAAPDASTREAMGLLSRHGVDVRNPQISNKAIQYLDSALDSLPLTAGKNAQLKGKQVQQFNRAVMRTVGSDADDINPATLDDVYQRLSGKYDDFVSRKQEVMVDGKFANDIVNSIRRYQESMPSLQNTEVGKILNDFAQVVSARGQGMRPGFHAKQFQSHISGLSNASRKLHKVQGDHDAAAVVDSLKKAMDDLLERNMGEADAKAFKTLRRQYANFKTIEDAANRTVGTRAGEKVTPTALYQAIKKQSPTMANRASGELSQLARAGEKFISPLPDSGTAQRQLWTQMLQNPTAMLGGGYMLGTGDPMLLGLAAGGMAAGPALQRAINSPGMRNYLSGQLIPENALTQGGGRALQGLLTTGSIAAAN